MENEKFWEWMEEKEYAEYVYHSEKYKKVACFSDCYLEFEKQELVGYAIEYCLEKKINFNISNHVTNVYNYLESVINGK